MRYEKSQPEYDYLVIHLSDKDIKLAFVENQERIFLMSSGYEARWPSEVLRSRNVSYTISGRSGHGVASLITDHSKVDDISYMFVHKYGQQYYDRYFSVKGRTLEIEKGRTVVDKADQNYYTWLIQEFDSVADQYDNHIFGNGINVILRNRSLEILREYLKPSTKILDIGCGTGAETLELLRSGFHVTAVDISERMLGNLKKKAIQAGLSDKLELFRGSASDLSFLLDNYGKSYFQLAYSTYGALNCEPHIEKMQDQLSSLLSEKGIFLAGVYNKYCLSETLLNLVSLKLNRITWRLKNPIREGRSRFCIDVYSFSPSEFMSLFSRNFRLLRTIAVPVILPPSNYHRTMRLFSSKLESLDRLDRKLSRHWPFNFLGDHFIQIMEKIR